MPTETSDEPKPIQLVLDELRQLKTDIDTIKRELVYIKREIIKATGMEQTKAGLVPAKGWFY
jgi:hypothetical protein|tara:strand:+ start:156 stop:341 length:186 start_codon:yes stop_codon:yes gene_type:complete